MNALETIAAVALLAVVAIAPGGEDNPPVIVRTESHREWVREQCARPDLSEDQIQSCKNYGEDR